MDRITLLALFQSNVELKGPKHPILKTRCHLWIGKRVTNGGYGRIQLEGKDVRATRLAWYLATGTWPEKFMLHRCDNPVCVRFDHLFEGDQLANIVDMHAKGRASGGSLPGASNPNAKLSDVEVAQLRAERASVGTSFRALARKYGISNVQAANIVKGRQRIVDGS